jgi:hypothetical protein
MKETTIVNTELEQALYSGTQREQALRTRATLSLLAPLVLGGLWLCYSGYEVHALQARQRTLEAKAAQREQQDEQAKADLAAAEAARTAAEKRAALANETQKAAEKEVAALKATLQNLRGDLDNMELAVTDLAGLRAKVAGLNNSEPIETQLTATRGNLARGFASIEKQINDALPEAGRKPKVYLFISEDSQRDAAKQLKGDLEESGFEVGAIVKNTTRKLDTTEIRFFRNPKDKNEAAQLQAIVEKDFGKTDARTMYVDDAGNAAGGRKFQIWLKKQPAAAR